MVYRYDTKHLTGQQQAIINQNDRENERIKKTSEEARQNVKLETGKINEAKEKLKQKEEQNQKDTVINQLELSNKEANELMTLINSYLENEDVDLREKIKLGLKSIKESLEGESKKYNKAKFFCKNQFERAFYKPAIRDCWVSISSFQYNRKPCQDMYSKVHGVADYTQNYLTQLKDKY